MFCCKHMLERLSKLYCILLTGSFLGSYLPVRLLQQLSQQPGNNNACCEAKEQKEERKERGKRRNFSWRLAFVGQTQEGEGSLVGGHRNSRVYGLMRLALFRLYDARAAHLCEQ